MSTIDEFARAYRNATPQELAGTVNLMAHPLAGVAAASALGLGLASYAFGIWAGAVAGATEASQKMFASLAEGEAQKPQPAKLRLVTSQPAPKGAPAAGRQATKRAAARKADETATPGVRPAAIERPEKPDDLKAISGVGPKLEQVLNRLGIWTYPQIAELTDGEIAWLDQELGFSGRIGRDDWTGQARKLAG